VGESRGNWPGVLAGEGTVDCSHVKRLLFELFGLAVVMMLPFPDFHP